MSRLGKLKEIIGSINDRVDELCSKQCDRYGIDAKKVVGCGTGGDVTESEKKKKASEATADVKSVASEVTDGDDVGESGDMDKAMDVDDVLSDPRVIAAVLVADKGASSAAKSPADSYDSYLSKRQSVQDMLTKDFKDADMSVDPALEIKVGRIAPAAAGTAAAAPGVLNRLFKKRLAKAGMNFLGKRGAKRIAGKAAAKVAAKTGGKVAGKAAGKAIGKAAAKSAAKKLPLGIGILPAAYFAAGRASKGDLTGAAGELASGAASTVPLLGTATSLGIDAYLAKRDYDREVGESYKAHTSLYDRARSVFEACVGVNESADGWCFDDYVMESKICNGILTGKREIDESEVFYGYNMVLESFDTDREELERLFRRLSPDGKVTMADLMPDNFDTDEKKRIKTRIRSLIEKTASSNGGELNHKDYKKALAASTNSSGRLTNRQMWHKGLDDTANSVNSAFGLHFVPEELSSRLGLPGKLGRLAGAIGGGLMFGPVGAAAGYGLANMLAKSHERYKQSQYDSLHGRGGSSGSLASDAADYVKGKGKDLSSGAGGMVGAGIGTLLGGPLGGIIGAGLGHLGQKGIEALARSGGEGASGAEGEERA